MNILYSTPKKNILNKYNKITTTLKKTNTDLKFEALEENIDLGVPNILIANELKELNKIIQSKLVILDKSQNVLNDEEIKVETQKENKYTNILG